MEFIIWFIIYFLIIYLLYFFFIILRQKEFNKEKIPLEIGIIIKKYKLDMSKIKYRKFLNTVTVLTAFSISLSLNLASLITDNLYLSILVALLILVPLIVIAYGVVGRIYVKRGFIKNEK